MILAGGGDMMGTGRNPDSTCQRSDGQDLVAEWLNSRLNLNAQGVYVNTTGGLEKAKVHEIDYLMGMTHRVQ